MAIDNLVVAITGSAGRLGKAFAKAVVSSGGRVVLGDINTAAGKKAWQDLNSDQGCFLTLDVCKRTSIQGFIDKGVEEFGKIDALVHAAYPRSDQWGAPIGQLTEESLTKDLFGQLGGAILVSQEYLEYFKQSGSGNIVHISSIQGLGAPKFKHYEGSSIVSPVEYTAIKAGVIAITRYLAKYVKNQNIRVNCISPGGILDGQPESFVTNYRQDCNSKGLLEATDVCGALLFLLSKESRFITGQNIVVDDGWSL